jgi:hypothetical protein
MPYRIFCWADCHPQKLVRLVDGRPDLGDVVDADVGQVRAERLQARDGGRETRSRKVAISVTGGVCKKISPQVTQPRFLSKLIHHFNSEKKPERLG